jgi:sec-independent protein translocase protein TatC
MTFLEHLEDLRKRLFNAFLVIILGAIPGWYFSKPIYNILARPVTDVLPEGTKLAFTTLTAPFMLYMKVAFLTSLFVTSPFVFLQLWYFIAPGLYHKERRYVVPFVFFTSFFFILGALFGYFMVFPWAVKFFISLAADFQPVITVDQYFSFVLRVLLGIALVFELPTLIFFLSKLGIVTARWMIRNFKYAVLAAFVIAAIITPTPDMITQTLVAVPMLALYGLSILIALVVGRSREKAMRSRDEEGGEGGDGAGERKKTRKEKKAEKAAQKASKKKGKTKRGDGEGGGGGGEPKTETGSRETHEEPDGKSENAQAETERRTDGGEVPDRGGEGPNKTEKNESAKTDIGSDSGAAPVKDRGKSGGEDGGYPDE